MLALESSADRASAAVLRTGMPGIQHLHEARHGHAALISELARAALAEAGVEPDEITHVAAGSGPGSFTGIRVALAAAKGFSLATGAAGTGVSCLAAAAHGASPRADGGHVIATADTRRGSYFAQQSSESPRAFLREWRVIVAFGRAKRASCTTSLWTRPRRMRPRYA